MAEKNFFLGMNKPEDSVNLNETEKKHTPVIEAPDNIKAGEPFEVTVIVGTILHVMEPAHHIQWIDVYAGENYLTKVVFTPGFSKPKATLTVVLDSIGKTSLKAVERCNIHGMWENTKNISVV
ncbi:MAG: class II SORL domain-containing protein [Methanosarcinales archaeon]|nr:class II SORL domain-containing protein [Methanosarcinales archaeon]